MHVIERTDRFTLIGADARRFKLTLFVEEGPRERGALKHVDAARRTTATSGTVADVGEGLTVNVVPAPTEVDYDLDHVALCSADPEATARGVPLARLQRGRTAGRRAARRGRRRVPRVPRGDRASPSGRCSTTSRCSSTVRTTRKELAREVADVVDAPNTYAVFVWGPERVKLEYVEHKPTFSLV